MTNRCSSRDLMTPSAITFVISEGGETETGSDWCGMEITTGGLPAGADRKANFDELYLPLSVLTEFTFFYCGDCLTSS